MINERTGILLSLLIFLSWCSIARAQSPAGSHKSVVSSSLSRGSIAQLPAKADAANKSKTTNKNGAVNANKRDAGVSVKTNTREVTIVGEVVDTWCYCSGVMGEGRGEEHKKCARLCLSGGVTAGIVTDDGTLYIAAKHQGYKGCAGLLLPYAAKRVKVKGWLAERGGCKILKIASVEEVK